MRISTLLLAAALATCASFAARAGVTAGNAWVHADLARAQVGSGFSVAIPLHCADNTFDHSEPGRESWKRCPADDFPFCVGLATSLQGNLLDTLTAGHDKWLAPALHPDVILKACSPRCTLLAHLHDAGHGALLSPQPSMARLGPIARDLPGDPPGFDRKQLSGVDRAITDFFQNHLLP